MVFSGFVTFFKNLGEILAALNTGNALYYALIAVLFIILTASFSVMTIKMELKQLKKEKKQQKKPS